MGLPPAYPGIVEMQPVAPLATAVPTRYYDSYGNPVGVIYTAPLPPMMAPQQAQYGMPMQHQEPPMGSQKSHTVADGFLAG